MVVFTYLYVIKLLTLHIFNYLQNCLSHKCFHFFPSSAIDFDLQRELSWQVRMLSHPSLIKDWKNSLKCYFILIWLLLLSKTFFVSFKSRSVCCWQQMFIRLRNESSVMGGLAFCVVGQSCSQSMLMKI